MSFEDEYREAIRDIIEKDPRYPPAAYDFVRDAVSFTTDRKLREGGEPSQLHHVSGQELLDGIRELALDQFGPLAMDVLDDWNVKKTVDFGNIVFNLVESRLLGASDEDSPQDFADGYDFVDAFVKPFVEVGPAPRDIPKIH